MDELEILLKVLEKIALSFGPIYGSIIILMALGIVIFLFYFKKRLGSIADEIANKSVAEFETKLQLLFRDEALRNNLQFHLGQKSVDKKLDLYNEVYSLYFQYQKSWFFNQNTSDDEFRKLWSDVSIMRQKVFLNSIYLGGSLYRSLLDAVIGMLNGLDETGKNPRNALKISFVDNEEKVSKALAEASKWLELNLFTHQDITMYEFTKEQRDILDKERNNFLSKKTI